MAIVVHIDGLKWMIPFHWRLRGWQECAETWDWLEFAEFA